MPEPVRLPRLYTEREGASELRVSVDTLQRERKRGRIAFTRIGRRIRYTEEHLRQYIENRTEQCRVNRTSDLSSLGSSGSVDDPTQTNGAEPGSTPMHDKHAAHLLAQAIFKPPN